MFFWPGSIVLDIGHQFTKNDTELISCHIKKKSSGPGKKIKTFFFGKAWISEVGRAKRDWNLFHFTVPLQDEIWESVYECKSFSRLGGSKWRSILLDPRHFRGCGEARYKRKKQMVLETYYKRNIPCLIRLSWVKKYSLVCNLNREKNSGWFLQERVWGKTQLRTRGQEMEEETRIWQENTNAGPGT